MDYQEARLGRCHDGPEPGQLCPAGPLAGGTYLTTVDADAGGRPNRFRDRKSQVGAWKAQERII